MELIRLIYTDEDVRDMAEEYGIDPDVAMRRATEWADAILTTGGGLISEQLASVIQYDTP